MTIRLRWGWGADDGAPVGVRPESAPQGTILDEIVAQTRADLVEAKRRMSADRLRRLGETRAPIKDFVKALTPTPDRPLRVISELKKASPSKGLIREDFGVVSLGKQLAAAGAAALSVLTEVHYFRGHPRYLQAVASRTPIPVLRKDFIVDPYQVYEAKAWGADAILLIAAALSAQDLNRLFQVARTEGLAVLAEAHNRNELRMVLDAGAEVVGVNSRDLRTFKTDLKATEELMAEIPDCVIRVAESGLHSHADLVRMRAAGADAFLIGETLMRAPVPGDKLRELLGEGAE